MPKLRYIEAAPAGTPRGEPSGTLVLLHAFPLHAGMWAQQMALSAHGWRIIAPHFRGMGDRVASSDLIAPVTSIDDYAGDVIDVLDSLHVDDAVVAGLSLGGYVAFALFRLAPRYVRGLVLADTQSQADTVEASEGRTRMLALVREKGPSAVADEMLPRLLGATTRAEQPELIEHVRSLVLDNSGEAIAGAIMALKSRPDSTSLLQTIHCPTLIVVGEEDAVTPISAADAMRRKIGGAELVAIPRAGHLSNLEQPDAFNAALGRFLDSRV
jgi:3-oxoadipate enol-lactonase